MPQTYGEMVEAGEPISELFGAVVGLHRALRAEPVKARVWSYAWSHEGRAYEVKLNGHLTQEVDAIPPLRVALEVDGWLRALVNPFDGSVIGPPGTEAKLIAAVQAETTRVAAVP